MEQNDVQNVETEKVETENVDTQTTKENEGAFKVFKTKEEYDNAFNKMKASILPPKEEMEQFKKWKEEQKTEDDKKAEKEAEKIKITNERDEYAKENKAFRKGVNPDDVDYVVFKVSKMEGNFEDNLEAFLSENPKYTKKQETKATGTDLKSGQAVKEDGVMAILKAKHPDIEF